MTLHTKISEPQNEEWREVDGTEGTYLVSNLGNIRRVDKMVFNKGSGHSYLVKGGHVAIHFRDGYKQCGVHHKGKSTTAYIHRLVAKAFIPNPENKLQVNHINNIRSDNMVENLEWVTPKENIRHYHKNFAPPKVCSEETRRRMSEAQRKVNSPLRMQNMMKAVAATRGMPSHQRQKINQFDLDGNFIQQFESLTAASKSVGGKPNALNKVKSGRLKTYKGFKWEYVK